MRWLLPLSVALVAVVIGLGLAQPSAADYGDPRFFDGQAPIRLLHNYYPGYYPDDEFIVTNPAGTPGSRMQMTFAAITSWNNQTRAAPNSLSKYVFHYNMPNDPNANIVVNFVDPATQDAECSSTTDDACNDRGSPITTIWVDTSRASTPLLTHEMGHSLFYTDQYEHDQNGNIICSPADTIMDAQGSPSPPCNNAITATDNADFQSFYEPTYQSTNPTYFDTSGSSWNVYYGGSADAHFPGSQVEYKYLWEEFTDTSGSLITSAYLPLDPVGTGTIQSFGYVVGSRYCIDDKIYNEVGYTGTRPWSPRSQYSCVGAAQNQSAGFFLGTSDRNSPSGNTLYLRVKNFSGGSRQVAIFGPNFTNIGCGYASVPYLGMRQCAVALSRGAYSELTWFASDRLGNISWGYLDFE